MTKMERALPAATFRHSCHLHCIRMSLVNPFPSSSPNLHALPTHSSLPSPPSFFDGLVHSPLANLSQFDAHTPSNFQRGINHFPIPSLDSQQHNRRNPHSLRDTRNRPKERMNKWEVVDRICRYDHRDFLSLSRSQDRFGYLSFPIEEDRLDLAAFNCSWSTSIDNAESINYIRLENVGRDGFQITCDHVVT